MVQARLCDIIFSFVSDGVLGGTMMHITPLYCQAFCFTGGGNTWKQGHQRMPELYREPAGAAFTGRKALDWRRGWGENPGPESDW